MPPVPPAVRRLFDAHVGLRVVIDAALEGRLGTVRGYGATAARVSLGCYHILGGAASRAALDHLLPDADLGPGVELVPPHDPGWLDALHDRFGARLLERPMRTFSSAPLTTDRLSTFVESLPAGYALRALDAPLAAQLGPALAPHGLQSHPSTEAMLSSAPAFGVLHGDRLVAACTPYARSAGGVEIAVSTHVDHRGRGLAGGVAAALARWCLAQGLHPAWTAANPISKRLALRLGYGVGPLVDGFILREVPHV
ncbi:MAG: GNAT family N-acetyltransferase [Alphaproteobacteria bacterium]|nr:GNAT family N-acetyltransferase [Alphaproteobacteria bacterium]